MDGYLVMARTTGDDVPVSLHGDLYGARRAAEALAENPEAVVAGLEIDWPTCNERCHVSIVTFENGRPVAVENVEFTNPDGPLDGGRHARM